MARARKAKAICQKCPVQVECYNHKVATGSTDGIWGGRSNSRKKN